MERSRAALCRARALCATTDPLGASCAFVECTGSARAGVRRTSGYCPVPGCSQPGRFKPYLVAHRWSCRAVIRDVMPPLCSVHRTALDAIFRLDYVLEAVGRRLPVREVVGARDIHVVFEVVA